MSIEKILIVLGRHENDDEESIVEFSGDEILDFESAFARSQRCDECPIDGAEDVDGHRVFILSAIEISGRDLQVSIDRRV